MICHLEKKPLLSLTFCLASLPQPKTNISLGTAGNTGGIYNKGNNFFFMPGDLKKEAMASVLKINGYMKTCKQRLTVFENFLGKTPFLQILHSGTQKVAFP